MKAKIFASTALVSLGLLTITGCTENPSAQAFADKTFVNEERVVEIVEQTLEENPEIILKAFLKAKQRQMKKQEVALSDVLASLSENPGSGPVLGSTTRNSDTLNVVLFEDYNCAFCKKQHVILSEMLKDNPNVSVTVKSLPIFGDTSKMAAVLALAVYDRSPEAYQKLNSKLMSSKKITEKGLVKAAEQIGFGSVNFEELYAKYGSQLTDNYNLASKLQLSGTPAMVVNGQLYRGLQTKSKLEGILVEKS